MFRFRWQKQNEKSQSISKLPENIKKKCLSPDLLTNKQTLQDVFKNCADFNSHPVYIKNNIKIMFFYLDGFTDKKILKNTILKPLLFDGLPDGLNKISSIGQIIEQQLLPSTPSQKVSKVDKLVDHILKGDLIVLVDGESQALVTSLEGMEHRSIEEPEAEVSIRGPRDGFNESIETNISLVRRRIRSPDLKLEPLTLGKVTQTSVIIAYIEGIAKDTLIKEVQKRVKQIQLDGILEAEYIEEFIQDAPYSPFPQIQNTERPDTVSAGLLEGKVVILVDNTPFALITPMTFWDGFQAAEDSYERFIYITFIRSIRFTMFLTAMFLPAVYVALATFHPKLIPTDLLISIGAARENVPFPIIIEGFFMELLFEGLREAGVRLPKAVGSAVSIVGALVIGEAAVQAGIVSAPLVIVVAATGIASFVAPRYNTGIALRLVRLPMIIFAGFLGLYGVAIGFIVLIIHLVNLRSFDVPYFTPVAPLISKDLKDVLVQSPKWTNWFGPYFTFGHNKLRIKPGQKPGQQESERNL